MDTTCTCIVCFIYNVTGNNLKSQIKINDNFTLRAGSARSMKGLRKVLFFALVKTTPYCCNLLSQGKKLWLFMFRTIFFYLKKTPYVSMCFLAVLAVGSLHVATCTCSWCRLFLSSQIVLPKFFFFSRKRRKLQTIHGSVLRSVQQQKVAAQLQSAAVRKHVIKSQK